MRLPLFLWLVIIVAGGIASPAGAAERFKRDFEQGSDPTTYEGLNFGKMEAEIVDGGPDAKGHCLRLQNPEPATACGLRLTRPITVEKNLILAFDHREEIEKGYQGAYLGISFYVDGKQWFWTSDEFSSQWQHAQVEIGKLRGSKANKLRPGLVFSGVQLYGRVKDKSKDRARIKVWFDNIRLYTGHPRRTLSERTRDSFSNPPMFHWPKFEEEGDQKLQYSMNQNFPKDASITVDVKSNFFTPAEPLDPGTWYWRIWSDSELSEGWSDIERVMVLPEAHRFTTRPVPVEELSKRLRPRLLEAAKIDQPEVTEKRKARLVKTAQRIYKGSVPEHPGPHVPGDPRWPTWIDWYGKVAGKITGGTGRRLQEIARCAMLTGDSQVIDWAKQMALDASKWDPDGGSAMRRGDIGAHHLLRGLNWCYDACRDHMTAEERATLKNTIIKRADQFYRSLNPFRGGEANNHAWLRALGVAESGIVLLGNYEKAGQWTEYVRQLYLGRFLCCLGYQGDNNEGISYWGYGLGFVIDYADLMRAVCDIDLYRHPWLAETARFPMYCAPPNAWAVSFADTGKPNHGVRGPAQVHRVRKLALRTADPYALWYSGQRESVNGITPQAPVDLPPSIHYRHIGVVIFNTSLVDGNKGATVAMHSGTYYAGHQHPDQNSFVIHAYGEKLAVDGGYYDWYGSPHFKAYSMTTLAHNTLLVDGRGQAACKSGADGRIVTYFDSPGYGYAVGDASNPIIYGGLLKRFDRRILFIKPGFVVIHDLVESAGKPARFDWLLHAIRPVEIGPEKNVFAIECEKAALRGRFLAPDPLGLEVKTGFPVEPVNGYSTNPVPPDKYFPEWVLYATPEKPTARTEFFAAMQIQRLGTKGQPKARIESAAANCAHAVRIKCDGHTHLVVFRKRGAQGVIQCGKLRTDGQAAAIEMDAEGKIVGALAAEARFLRYNEKTLLESPSPKNQATKRPLR